MMKKLSILLMALLLLVGCSQAKPKQPETPLTMLAPKGAPALSLLGCWEGNEHTITTVDGTDVITAAFTAPESEYDIIIAPINLGATLIQKGATEYRLAAVVTWGNLYLLSTDQNMTLDAVQELAAFGQNAVPGKIWGTVTDADAQNVTWFNSVADVVSALLSGQYQTGLVAEPVCSNALKKSAASEHPLYLVGDLQEAWKEKTGLDQYPQAAVFVKPSVYEAKKDSIDAVLDQMMSYAPSDIESLKASMDAIGQEALGVSSEVMSMETYQRMHVACKPATEVQAQIEAFLELFGITDTTDLYVEVKH